MAGEGPFLDGEDEYLEVTEDQSECGTQVDGDDVAVLHESYNFTQVDDDNQYPLDPLSGDEESSDDLESDQGDR
jgi:hypothetical protein